MRNQINLHQPPKPAVREVKGIPITLGAGTFDLRQVKAVISLFQAQTGAMIYLVKVLAKIRSNDDQIKISRLSSVTFTLVSTPFVTTHTLATLYAGTFIIGQDRGAGRYVATTTPGSSGNCFVRDNNSVNEILGQNGYGGVPNFTIDLTDGPVITSDYDP
jgi:hypothetical protein